MNKSFERIIPDGTPFGSLHEKYDPEICKNVHGNMRVVFCDNSEYDVVECVKCGYQMQTLCTFDDDYD